MLRNLWRHAITRLASESGQGMVEYGLIIGLVAAGLIILLSNLGGGLQSIFSKVTSTLSSAGS